MVCFCHNAATQWLVRGTSGTCSSVHLLRQQSERGRISRWESNHENLKPDLQYKKKKTSYMSILRCYCKPSSTSAVCVKPLFYASLVKLHIRRGRGGGVRWGVEVTEALLGQVSVLVVVEGLTWQLAEEVGPEPGAACGTALIWGTVGGCQRLCAAATVYTTEERRKKITDSQLRLNNSTFCEFWLIQFSIT